MDCTYLYLILHSASQDDDDDGGGSGGTCTCDDNFLTIDILSGKK